MPAGELSYYVIDGSIKTGHRNREGRVVDLREAWLEVKGSVDELNVKIKPQRRSWWEVSQLGEPELNAFNIKTSVKSVEEYYLIISRNVVRTFITSFSIRFLDEVITIRCDVYVNNEGKVAKVVIPYKIE
ncbi:MAG: hypothetical protein UU77_C0013G0008 [candidate division WWE3 bacterium GW2011_GWC1_41_7]|uniref:Uncharacterized protein n=4 Tax=Katanobacteria TaxID=422282 RepID=A0A0G0XA63_UNCKA|nr:MAG: hypothetical protein UU72_C0019G0008 [candidate division WWE3 bacterium GW2011_GWB1_41_6]KKS20893.1 MAG: hypothetical protein UU77_C0013G0008 [candidate division WWE3 bacterium GW2011_GWC1_41_7]KKS21874.1 MAG: hypothetical protein UU80_C0018G0010 [candidate division WWE3 bacterium GW2011_GWA1_41_8]OGC57902.1 MAG: hypothetical protein A2976_00320 [candidate division WWE3 bacterium RIFCSPLOWO2_01_FULL_41_9]